MVPNVQNGDKNDQSAENLWSEGNFFRISVEKPHKLDTFGRFWGSILEFPEGNFFGGSDRGGGYPEKFQGEFWLEVWGGGYLFPEGFREFQGS